MKRVLIWLSLSAVLVLVLGLALSIRSSQVPTSGTSHGAAQLIVSENFDTVDALSRFRIAQPDLGFKAGSQDKPAWRIEGGRLVAHQAHNATLWLTQALPPGDLKVTFTAHALSKEGDVKCEFAGDGEHHQSGYIFINGGWKNTMRAIARQDEHGEDRREDGRCGKRRECVPLNQDVKWEIERRGNVLTWYLNGQLALRYQDTYPLQGRYFGFNNWSAEVQYDDLRVYHLLPN